MTLPSKLKIMFGLRNIIENVGLLVMTVAITALSGNLLIGFITALVLKSAHAFYQGYKNS